MQIKFRKQLGNNAKFNDHLADIHTISFGELALYTFDEATAGIGFWDETERARVEN